MRIRLFLHLRTAILIAALLGALIPRATADTISLAGRWRFHLDRQDAGVRDQWFACALPDSINLPGSLPAQGIGDEITPDTKWTGAIVNRSWFTAPEYAKYRQPGNIKVPFWLQPNTYYAGIAWYQKDIEIPQKWLHQRIVLSLERPHWETRVWVDGKYLGSNNALSTPHEYDLGSLAPGKHKLSIRVDNRMVLDVGENSHSVSDHTQGNWNGIVGRIELRATPAVWIEDMQIYPQFASRKARVRVVAMNPSGHVLSGKFTIRVGSHSAPLNIAPISQVYQSDLARMVNDFEISLGSSVQPWDEFSPNLYTVSAQFQGRVDEAGFCDEKSCAFGLREISTQGTQFLVNGRKTFFRGTLDCCIYPKTGHPPTDVASWKHVISVAKAHGLNLIRFHSWCPPEAAFVAADELGFYFHVEADSWANGSTTIGDGKPVDAWIYEETDRILKAYGNHPSFVLMPYGNEPGGDKSTAYLAKWVSHFKSRDARRLFTSGAGWPQIPENQFHVTPDPRIQAWGGGLGTRINAKPPETTTDYRDYIHARNVPVISHEIGQWCVYPNFQEISKYTGYLKPKNFEIFRDTLEDHHMGSQARQFLLASGKLQTLCYKEEIESALRTPGMGGFELLDLHDFPGQGTALVGVLDPFWEGKGYVTAKEFRRFCNSTVPLARMAKRVFTTDENFAADIEISHFGAAPLDNVAIQWSLKDEHGKKCASGKMEPQTIPVNNGTALGRIQADLKGFRAPARYQLVVSVPGTEFQNDWDVWVYPAKLEAPKDSQQILVSEAFNEPTIAALHAGGKVLLLLPPSQVKNDPANKIALGFSSIFWNTAWTANQPPTTLGILCHPESPALAHFPTEYHSNWQWWYLISRAGAMMLDGLPSELQPTVQVIDDWVTARKLALIFEAKVGKGKLVVCSIDLKTDLDQNPVARQMLHSLKAYMASADFKPKVELHADQVKEVIQAPMAPTGQSGGPTKAASAP